ASPLPVMLVIDNVHELVDAREASLLLSWLIESAPDGTEIFLAGRERPFIPSLSAAIATGAVTVLDGSQLAFTVDEIRDASEGATSTPAAEILAATGGWPVGVMAALSGSVPPEKLSAKAFGEYLETEVWAQVPEELRDALRRFSLQPTISRAAVDAEFGATAWRNLTSWLSTRDFLCEHLSPVEFRLNPLLRQFIANEFDAIDPKGYAESLNAAVADLVQAGNLAEAIEFMRASGDEFQLAALLEAHSPQLIIQGSLTLLMRSFECISEPTLRRRPLLRGMFARVIAHLGDPEEAVRRADGLLRDAGAPVESRAHAQLARIRALRLLGRMDDAKETVIQLTNLLSSIPAPLQAEVQYHLAEYELSVSRDFIRAEELLKVAIDGDRSNGIDPLALLARSTLGQSLAMRGAAPEAVTVLTKAAQGWRSLGRSSNLGWVLNNLGMSHIQAGDFASAATVLQEAVDEGVNCGNQRNVAYATASLGDAKLALGQFEAARIQYEEAIRICATDALDESLAALSIAGLSAALLGKADLQQADFFARRALLVALSSANSYEIAICKLQQAAVEYASGNFAACVAEASDASGRFHQMEVLPMLATAEYRVSMAHFKANKRVEAEAALAKSAAALTETWMAATLVPLVRENPMFAQWAATRRVAASAFKTLIEQHKFDGPSVESEEEVGDSAMSRYPLVSAHSLGKLSVSVGGREIEDEDWASARAKEMFFLLLQNRQGIRKEEAVEYLYPELPREKCNSAFHSNLYRIRRALFQDSVVKGDDGIYQLNPDALFEWDVKDFQDSVERARKSPAGSRERAVALQEALELYAGPFATAFQSEWAAAVRDELEDAAHESLATLAGYFAGRNDFESAAMCMERVLRANRLNEEAAFQFATYRSRAGQVVQALRFIDEFSNGYEAEFGEVPPARFSELRSSIAAGVAV
ncbi:MAG: tetratricopeptide repeat protein, partial [bacterium]